MPTTTPEDTLLGGLNEKSRRSDLFSKIRELAGMIHQQDDQRLGRLQQIENDVRAKYEGTAQPLAQLHVSNTHEEWDDVIDFLDNFEDMLPHGLTRVLEGARAIRQHDDFDPDGGS